MTAIMDSATVDVDKLQAIADEAAAETSETSETETSETSESQKAYQRYPDVPRLFTQHDLGKMLEVSPATIANAGIAPEFVREGTDQMFWTETETWQTWAWLRAERKFNNAQKRAKAEAEQVAKLAGTVATHASNIDAETKRSLLIALLSDEEKAALGLS